MFVCDSKVQPRLSLAMRMAAAGAFTALLLAPSTLAQLQQPEVKKGIVDPMVVSNSTNPPQNGPRGGGNDECSSAIVIAGSPVTLQQNAINATTGTAGQGNAACQAFNTRNINNDEWFLWFANASGVAVLRSCGGGTMDTKAAVWDGTACPPSSIVACNDDACSTQSELAFVVFAGNAYLIQLGIFPGATPGTATWTLTGPATPAGTDSCAAGTILSGDSGTAATDTTGATNTPADVLPNACGSSVATRDIWYTYLAGNCGVSTFSFCPAERGSAAYDTLLEVYTDCASAGGERVACNDDFCGLRSSVTFPTAAGASYKIRVSGFNGNFGMATVGWQFLPSAFLNGTDDCGSGSAISGSGSLFTGNLFAGNTPSDLPAGACFASSPDRWFTYTAAASGDATFSFCSAQRGCGSYDTILAAYSSCQGTQIACSDDFCGLYSTIVVPVVVGSTYKIRLAGFNNQTGTGVLGWTAPPAPSNNNCANATPVGNGTFNFTIIGATNDFAASCGSSNASPDVWFRYTASCTGTATVTTCDLAGYDTVLGAVSACGGTEIACLDDFCGLQTRITFPVSSGQQYLVRVSGFSNRTGAGQVRFSCGGPCPCNWNQDAFLNSQDFFDFLSAFFANNADYNTDGFTNSQDFFDFLSCFFTGCP
ncbi:MAG: hypothetical protein H7210_08375 [Pyrinomonadaceae bacterium]|nr:hypothetical protein [Phycisphaerales bacterium]